jgi:hypothetical protein
MEPAWVGIGVTVILAAVAGCMYVIRAEVRKGNTDSAAAHVELIPNHGSSLRDAVDRIEARQIEDRATFLGHVADLHANLNGLRNRVDNHIDRQQGKP